MTLSLPKGTLLQIQAKDLLATPVGTELIWNNITEHNRSPISISTNRIQKTERMANGQLRKFYVTDKKNFNVSWSLVPSYRTGTVDGYWGAEDLKTFYYSTAGAGTFDIMLNFAKDGTKQDTELLGAEKYTVSFTDCSFELVKRGYQAHWNISLSMEQV